MTTTRRGSSRGKRATTLRSSDRGTLWLMVHTPEFGSGDELVINPECFPDVQLWDLVEISQPDREHQRLILQVTALAPVRGRLQISVLKDIAAQFGLEAFYEVVVQKVDPRDITADFLELTFKDQFLSRADLWRFKVAMFGKCVYVGKNMEMLGVRSQVEALVSSNQNILCGVIGADTKMVVRSRSSRLFWLVQMSTEMWEFAPDGELYYEKLINRLLRVLIEKWNDCSVSHSLTVIAFSRSFYDKDQFPEDYDPTSPPFVDPVRQGFGPGCSAAQTGNGYGPNVHVHPINGRYFEDFYKVLVMNYTGPDWSQLSIILKREFIDYHRTHRWRMAGEVYPADYELMPYHDEAPTADQDEANRSSSTNTKVYVKWKSLPFGVPTRATDGNILEAINVTLNILDKHYMDRDLNRTGQSIVMLTAGSGVFNVDERLAQITKQRMMDNGVESFYTLTLPSADMDVFPKYKNHDELLIEMVCQRLAGDFQLVATDAGTDVDVSRNRVPAGTMNRGPSGESRDARSNTVTYHLSMGHRIHQIIYDAELQTIEVKRYFERASQGEHNEPKVYNYSLWVEHTQSFQPLQQKFYQYPMPEDNWNSLDHLLCGYHDEMFDTTKCRRIRFAIVPPSSVSASTASVADKMAYVEKFTRFIEYLQSRVGPQGGVQEHIVVQIVMERPPTSSLRSQNRMLSFKMSCETLSSYTRLKSGDSRKEWVMVRVEDTMFVYKCFHFDVRWLACSGIVVDDFISTVKRKAKQAGLELRRVPEYSSVSFLQIHALVAPIFLPMTLAIMCNSEQERTLVAILTSRLDFVLDDERLADAMGIGYGLGLGEEVRPSGTGFQRFSQGRFLSQAAKEAHLAEKWRKRGYKQYMHRRVPVFLRLIHNGLVWIPGYDYDQLSSTQQTHDLFKEICTAIETCSNLPSSCCGSEAA
ncbi:hypothetical protein Poli38472_013077 [Pythium oligandrum]|uniref:DEP domain-containing protein n=1 Tax=Pythium oligandrum TaxID=41045 RepID=A0A8K1FI01_PYTOL|nr:hypothetical protein Poli38472_013077 [Pythium oligandrum]|eukprot:TMW64455.1 hypothetical protein Poli38472_013077 [Pythium oligandrum]